jgi:alanyl-tRNA synthetase
MSNIIALRTAFNAYRDLASREEELMSEIAVIREEKAELVATMATSLPEGTTNFKAEGKTLTPVVGGGKGGNSNFLRGWATKSDKVKNVVEVLDLDSDA